MNIDQISTLRIFWRLGSLLIVSMVGNAILLFRFLWRRPSRIRSTVLKTSMLAFSLAFTFIFLEFFFAYMIHPSDGFGHTLSSKLWFKKYWNPVNAYGYRDYPEKHFDGRSVLFVVGDSFVAGHGIKRIQDRFPNKLAEMLGSNWEHVVIAQNGWQTEQELAAVREQQVVPDVIVWSYFLNDIQDSAEKIGIFPKQYFAAPSPLASKVIDKSFFFNFVYWRFVRATMGDDYWEYLRQCYSNPSIWELHCEELQAVIDLARTKSAKLYVVVWPNLSYIEQSRELTDRVVEFFKNQDISVVDLAFYFSGRRPEQLVVNSLDGHPNPRTHHEVATLLFEQLSNASAITNK